MTTQLWSGRRQLQHYGGRGWGHGSGVLVGEGATTAAAAWWAEKGDNSVVVVGEGATAAPWWAGRGPWQWRAGHEGGRQRCDGRRGSDRNGVVASEGATQWIELPTASDWAWYQFETRKMDRGG